MSSYAALLKKFEPNRMTPAIAKRSGTFDAGSFVRLAPGRVDEVFVAVL